jgi:phage baseplate assembly protein W
MVQTAGMDRRTGKKIKGNVHLEQSIRDILTTRVEARVILRDYGSDIPPLVDSPINAATITAFYGATAVALAKWEPRLLVKKMDLDLSRFSEGRLKLGMTAWYKPDGYFIRLDNIVLDFVL